MEAASSWKQHLAVSQVRSLWRSQGYKEDHNSEPKHLHWFVSAAGPKADDTPHISNLSLSLPLSQATFQMSNISHKAEDFIVVAQPASPKASTHIYSVKSSKSGFLGFCPFICANLTCHQFHYRQIKWDAINPVSSIFIRGFIPIIGTMTSGILCIA